MCRREAPFGQHASAPLNVRRAPRSALITEGEGGRECKRAASGVLSGVAQALSISDATPITGNPSLARVASTRCAVDVWEALRKVCKADASDALGRNDRVGRETRTLSVCRSGRSWRILNRELWSARRTYSDTASATQDPQDGQEGARRSLGLSPGRHRGVRLDMREREGRERRGFEGRRGDRGRRKLDWDTVMQAHLPNKESGGWAQGVQGVQGAQGPQGVDEGVKPGARLGSSQSASSASAARPPALGILAIREGHYLRLPGP